MLWACLKHWLCPSRHFSSGRLSAERRVHQHLFSSLLSLGSLPLLSLGSLPRYNSSRPCALLTFPSNYVGPEPLWKLSPVPSSNRQDMHFSLTKSESDLYTFTPFRCVPPILTLTSHQFSVYVSLEPYMFLFLLYKVNAQVHLTIFCFRLS